MRKIAWRAVRWVGGPIALCFAFWVIWMVATYLKAQRFHACSDVGGFWNDEERICYFLRCEGRPNEERVDRPGPWRCALKGAK